MKVELTWDQAEPVVRQALRDDIRTMQTSKLKDRIFSRDLNEEKAQRKEMLDALKKVQSWYGK